MVGLQLGRSGSRPEGYQAAGAAYNVSMATMRLLIRVLAALGIGLATAALL